MNKKFARNLNWKYEAFASFNKLLPQVMQQCAGENCYQIQKKHHKSYATHKV